MLSNLNISSGVPLVGTTIAQSDAYLAARKDTQGPNPRGHFFS